MTDPNLDRILHTDPIVEAERITGRSYKEDEATLALSMLTAMAHGDRKRKALAAAGDTHSRMTFSEFTGTLQLAGFEQVHEHTFYSPQDARETYTLWWRDGLLATAETYTWELPGRPPGVNAAKVYYNYRYTPHEGFWPGGSYSGIDTGDQDTHTLAGDSDVREGLLHTLATFAEHGEFVSPWIQRPFLWLLDYSQTKVPGYDYKAINEAVIATLPAHVHAAITPEADA